MRAGPPSSGDTRCSPSWKTNKPIPPVPGDVTQDGLVDIADVNAVVNIMLGKATQTAAADVTGEGTVDIADVNAVINIMLGK